MLMWSGALYLFIARCVIAQHNDGSRCGRALWAAPPWRRCALHCCSRMRARARARRAGTSKKGKREEGRERREVKTDSEEEERGMFFSVSVMSLCSVYMVEQ
jgi:hypothetical protein